MYFRIHGYPVAMHANVASAKVNKGINEMLETLVEDNDSPTTKFGPGVNIVEHKEKFEIVAELPGVKKEDLTIKVENRELHLSAERKPYDTGDTTRVVRRELQRAGTVERSFRIPDDVDSSEISAQLNDGILRIELPKKKAAQPMEIRVK